MEIGELIDRVGIGMAALIIKGKIPKGFWKELTLNECLKICESCQDPQLKERAAFMAIRKAENIFDYYEIFNKTTNEQIQLRIIRKIWRMSNSFRDCFELARCIGIAECDPKLANAIIAKSIWLAKSTDECFDVYRQTSDPDLEEKTLNKGLRLATSTDECEHILRATKISADLKARAIAKALTLAQSTIDCLSIIGSATTPDEKEAVLSRATLLARYPNDWLHLRFYYSGSMKETALANAIDLITTVEEGKDTYRNECDETARTAILEKIREIANINPIAA